MARSVRFGGIDFIPESSTSTNQLESPNTQSLQSRTSELRLQSTPNSSLWKIPGIEKDTFYAAALFLHVKAGELEGRPWARGPKTPQATRAFLDHLADCFARSKLRDARDHVSATTMVREDQHRKITLYIAKNRSSKPSEALISRERDSIARNENEDFAKQLVQWFNDLARVDTESTEADGDRFRECMSIFTIMCEFNQSRLEHYITKISELDVGILERALPLESEQKFNDGWEAIESVIGKCCHYQGEKSKMFNSQNQKIRLLTDCAILAGETRKCDDFRYLAVKGNTAASNSGLKRLMKAIEGIQYLGRLYAACSTFFNFCKNEEQRDYTFEYVLLPSEEDKWTGGSYIQKILSWAGDLGLDDVETTSRIVGDKCVAVDMTVKDRLEAVANDGRETAPVHCEIQLLTYFLRPGAPKCVDYFGCSKKSCWLCWHMMVENCQFSMKDTHRKIYPRWAVPSELTLSYANVAEGLKIAYNEMLSLLQHKAIKGTNLKSPGPFLQSSARITPHDPNQESGSGYFSGDHIEALNTEQLPITKVPALYIPQDGSFSDVRSVTVSVYQEPRLDIGNYLSLRFGSLQVVLAFQLFIDFGSLGESSEPDEFQALFWVYDLIPGGWSDTFRKNKYRMFYRIAEVSLAPNRLILETWRGEHGDLYGECPWRGDVFILCTSSQDIHSIAENLEDARAVDCSNFLAALAKHFRSLGPEGAVKTRKRQQDTAARFFRISRYKKEVDMIGI
ncbi:hypothetical protein F4824DRAFT_477551 [Ustulina deusta]|nr:hypothetical protein F4824DRAFT_477551 [Ustulina deusta]